MATDHSDKLRLLFERAVGLSSEEQARLIDRECSEDPALRAELQQLLDQAARDTEDLVPTITDTQSVFGSQQIQPGTVLGRRYKIETFVERGGMGEVFRAVDLDLDVRVAIKTIRGEFNADPVELRRFKQEVLLARSITHPNVCRIYDLGQDEGSGVAFLTMEFLSGETLDSRIRKNGPLNPGQALPLVRDLTHALEAAHRAGVVHRDLKSANIMLVDRDGGERAVIMDFGIAVEWHRTDLDEPESRSPGLVGTPAYMAPEQIDPGHVTPASDLYSLGVVLFEALTGRLPFQYERFADLIRAQLNEAPPSPREFVELDDRWEHTILQLLSKNPADRYASATEMLEALEGQTAPSPAHRHALPPERDAFVGRASDVDVLRSRLEESGVGAIRLLTLLGAGGSGKTRLAVRYGWSSLARWAGGVWFCDLASAVNKDEIGQAVGLTLGVQQLNKDPSSQLREEIPRLGECLIILDNFEQVAAHAEETLGTWIQAAPEARFLVTSRARIRLPEESVQEVESLDPETHGVELFEVRAQSHRPGFEVDDASRPVVEEIVRQLDGLPLAIELAAARTRTLSLEQLRDRLSDRFRILSGGRAGRQSTLQTALDWSWELLQPAEQAALVQASVFVGGCTLEAAEAVIDVRTIDETVLTLDLIQSLVDRSWLRTRVVDGRPRFGMYTTVRAYAEGKLETSSERDHEARFRKYFVQFLEEMDPPAASQQKAAMDAVSEERENILAAREMALEVGELECVIALTQHLAPYWEACGPFGEGLRVEMETLEKTRELGETPERAAICQSAAGLAFVVGDRETSAELYESCLTLYRHLGDAGSQAWTHLGLSLVHHFSCHHESARAECSRAIAILSDLGDPGRVRPISLFALYNQKTGRYHEATEALEEALSIHRDAGWTDGVVRCLAQRGAVSLAQEETELASKLLLDAYGEARSNDWESISSSALQEVASLARDLGNDEMETECWNRSVSHAEETGNFVSLWSSRLGRGGFFLRKGDSDAALEELFLARECAESIGDRPAVARVDVEIARARSARGEHREASRLCVEASSALQRMDEPSVVVSSLAVLVRIELDQNEGELAARLLGSMASIHERSGLALPFGLEAEIQHLTTDCKAALGTEFFDTYFREGGEEVLDEILRTVRERDSADRQA